MLKHIFLDLDDTILDFTAGEAKALSQALTEVGIAPTKAVLDRYHIINQTHWQLLEEGRLTRDEVLVRGGLNAGLRTVWFDPHGKPTRDDIRPTYTIRNLAELPSLLSEIV